MGKQEKLFKIIWWLYVALLFVFVVVKFNGSISDLSDRIHFYSAENIVNYSFVPFKNIRIQIRCFPQWWAVKNLLGNILLFAPFGVLLPIAYKKYDSAGKVFAAGLLSILSIESFQLFTKLGSFDVDDILLNMAGIACGYFMFLFIRRLFPKKR